MQHDDSLLGKIKGPRDLRNLCFADLNRLAGEIREQIIAAVSRNGGHLASNLGVVELTIALHRILDSPEDRIVWDVGHQCYAHKLLTGRQGNFATLRKENGLAGFPKYSESPHDWFNTGHASTSISAALGFLAGEKILEPSPGAKRRCAVAVIGDGALTGGLAYEALSHAGQLGLPLIVILNDNKMSIGPNVGGLSKYLSRLSMKAKYQIFRRAFDNLVKKLPFIGDLFFNAVVRLKRAVKAVFYTDNFFVDLGFEYVGPIDGHNIQSLCGVIKDARNLGKPVVVHVITQKGKGYGFAEDDPGAYHGVPSFSKTLGIDGSEQAFTSRASGNLSAGNQGLEPPARQSFTEVFGATLWSAAKQDCRVVGVTAAMEKGTGLSRFKKDFPDRFFDVGIAEEHAVTFAAGLAKKGLRPVVAIYSTFIQRGVDQVIHDVCLQKLPVVFALDRAGFVSDDGETHQGLYDISLFRGAPNMSILAPATEGELEAMLHWALWENNAGPTIIRYPKEIAPRRDPAFSSPLEKGRGILLPCSSPKSEVCLAFTGSLYPQALDAAELLGREGENPDLYNIRFINPVDETYLAEVMNSYKLFVVAEEGIRAGGFGEYATALASRQNCSCRVLALGVSEGSDFQGKRTQLLHRNGLDGQGIAAAVLEARVSPSPGCLTARPEKAFQ